MIYFTTWRHIKVVHVAICGLSLTILLICPTFYLFGSCREDDDHFSVVPSVGKIERAGTPTALLICALTAHRLQAGIPQLFLHCPASYAETRMTEVLIPQLACFSLSENPFHAHITTMASPSRGKGWGVPLVMGLVPLISRKRGRGFFSLRDHSASGELFFPTLT